MNKNILLSFDVEEFDIPKEYGQNIPDYEMFKVSLDGLNKVVLLLNKLSIRATFFVTANFSESHPDIILKISQYHEIASHGYYHSSFNIEDLKKSRLFLEKLIGQQVKGFRMPRLENIDCSEILNAGYEYNSSMNPTYIPGRYNNLLQPRTAYYENNLLNVPISVTPLIRFPLFWLSFKNFPLWFTKYTTQITVNHDKYLNIYFHPWEFADIKNYSLPSYIKNISGQVMLEKLEHYLLWLKTQGKFISISEFQATRLCSTK
ncbi:MAG: polysaccharide deacetylase family protein [Scytonematopsis contorta HA4267-MV1]|jgi:peptidoglycan/xylan/chitin deacetylase (PgdA/CDA1 family)|nr:polysaccharide deacetylase family protein [Scytonematopsis contorta HA4267-MV1]